MENQTTSERPIAITIFCIVLGLFSILGIVGLLALSNIDTEGLGVEMPTLPSWYTGMTWVLIIGQLASLVGIWMMKKWGAMLYIALAVLGIVIQVVAGQFSIWGAAVSLVLAGVVVYYFKQMT